jgi:hypothetical protein
MAAKVKSSFWRRCRVGFRRVRVTVWFLLFLLVGSFIYLNQVGLPDFAKEPLLEKLRQLGLDLQFSRLRLRWYEGIVADNARFARAEDPLSPHLDLQEVQVLLNWGALTRRQLQVDSLLLHKGRLVWPIAETNQAPRDLVVEDIESKLRFLPGDEWALDHFEARFGGVRIQLSGIVTNASAIRDWQFAREPAAAPASITSWRARLRAFANTLDRIHFPIPPDLIVDVSGDARDLPSFGASLLVAAPGADTPWGNLTEGRFNLRLFPATTNGLSRAEVSVEALRAQTPWGALTNLALRTVLQSSPEEPGVVHGDLTLSSDDVQTEWAEGRRTVASVQWSHSITNPMPLSGRVKLQSESVKTKWAGMRKASFTGSFSRVATHDVWTAPDPSWGWWTNLQPYSVDWDLRTEQLDTQNLRLDELACAGRWAPPRLSISGFQGVFLTRYLKGQAELDVAERDVHLSLSSTVDPQTLNPVLPEAAKEWLKQFSWVEPPLLEGQISARLPAWTNPHPDWQAEVLPNFQLAAKVDAAKGGTFRDKLRFTSARSHVLYSNMTWYLPDLNLTRPEGRLVVEHQADERTRRFYWHAVGAVDVGCVRPFLDPPQQEAFDLFRVSPPVVLDAAIWGESQDEGKLGARASLVLTNLAFRGESFSRVETALQYTNARLQFFSSKVVCGSRQATVDGLAVDFGAGLIYLTNAVSTLDPGVITRVIGGNVPDIIAPYQFLNPPASHIYGVIPMHGPAGADLHFDLDGGPFHWWKFSLPHVSGHVHWLGQHLTLSDLRADFYGGEAAGAAKFDFPPATPGTDFQFAVGFTNVQLHSLMVDLLTATNHLEGWLNGALSVTKANSEVWQSVYGYGEATLRDGLLWDIPVFGIFSPILNSVSPGLGNSRAGAGSCGFVITNGYIFSNDLQIRTGGTRLKYRGTVDLESRVNARVEAELLRDMWAVGPLVSVLFTPVAKMFEYKVSNTLGDPKMEPVYIVPKLVLFPLHPLRTIKNLFENPSGSQTNTPASPRQ